jgi:hypothetical protein
VRRLVAGLLAAATLTGCGGSSGPSGDRLRLAPSTTTTTTPATEALAARLPTTVLDGFTRADAAVGSGPLDLEAAATSANDVAAERERLRARGFVRGLSRSWVSAASADTVYVAVYEFRDAAGAAAYAADQAAALDAAGAIPFGSGGGSTTIEPDGEATLTTHAAIRQEGTRWALVLVASERGDRTPEEAKQIAASVRL